MKLMRHDSKSLSISKRLTKPMKLRFTLAIVFILFLVRLETPAAPAPQAAQVTLPQQGPSEVRVQLGKSLLITSQEELQRVAVTDPSIASAVVVSPNQVLINGLK